MVEIYKSVKNSTVYTLNSTEMTRETQDGKLETSSVYVILPASVAKERIKLLQMGVCSPDMFFEEMKKSPNEGYIFWQEVNQNDGRIIIKVSSLVKKVNPNY